jgi:hypothetical protein
MAVAAVAALILAFEMFAFRSAADAVRSHDEEPIPSEVVTVWCIYNFVPAMYVGLLLRHRRH